MLHTLAICGIKKKQQQKNEGHRDQRCSNLETLRGKTPQRRQEEFNWERSRLKHFVVSCVGHAVAELPTPRKLQPAPRQVLPDAHKLDSKTNTGYL